MKNTTTLTEAGKNRDRRQEAGVLRFLKKYRSFLVTAHLSPDGDAIGSEIALALHLEATGKEVFIVNDEPLPPLFRFLAHYDRVLTLADFRKRGNRGAFPEASIFIECCTSFRAGETGHLASHLPSLNIDHHADNAFYGRSNLVDASVSACGEIVYRLIRRQGGRVTPEIATAVYTAILTDTSSFRFNLRPGTLRLVAELVERGACPDRAAAAIYEQMSFEAMQLLALALGTLRQTPDGLVTWCRVERSMLSETGTTDADSEGFIDYLRVVGGSRATFILKELPNGRTRVNLRSKGDCNIQPVAAAFGGGGHRNAAGCTVDAGLAETERLILGELKLAVAAPGRAPAAG